MGVGVCPIVLVRQGQHKADVAALVSELDDRPPYLPPVREGVCAVALQGPFGLAAADLDADAGVLGVPSRAWAFS